MNAARMEKSARDRIYIVRARQGNSLDGAKWFVFFFFKLETFINLTFIFSHFFFAMQYFIHTKEYR